MTGAASACTKEYAVGKSKGGLRRQQKTAGRINRAGNNRQPSFSSFECD